MLRSIPFFLFVFVSSIFVNAFDPEPLKIVVGPNILVSRDGDIPHVELIAASNPMNGKNLLGAAITASSAKGSWASKVYSSNDGGVTWSHVSFPELHLNGGLDPQVAFGATGTAYFSAIRFLKDDKGNDRADLLFYRSEDGGVTWQKPADLSYSYDHPILTVDHTKGKYSGRIYECVLYGYPVYHVGIFRSADDGRTFQGPFEAANGGGKIGINTISNILVMRDGTLMVPYVDFEFVPEKNKKEHSLNFWLVSSADGGFTFSKAHQIGKQEVNNTPEGLRFFGVATAAVDRSDKYPDRMYLVWNNFTSGKYRMMISVSTDRGATWSAAKAIDPGAPANSNQYQPAVAVNNNGLLGVTWFDTRNSSDDSRYDEYFSASLDGGETFVTPVRISSESSFPAGAGNQNLIPSAYTMQGKLLMDFTSAYSRWSNGGDYMGLTTDGDGRFFPFWADSRTGTFQINTAMVRFTSGADDPVPVEKTETDVSDRVEVMFDPTKYDASSKIIEIPIHIKNISKEKIYAPLKVELLSVGGGFEWEDKEQIKKNIPEILNATNGKKADGAIFDLSPALGSEPWLNPGSVSGAIVWRMKIVDPTTVPSLHLKITGSVVDKK